MENNKEQDEKRVLGYLQDEYAFMDSVYSMNFISRLMFEWGGLEIYTSPDAETKALTQEELIERMKNIKTPWWNFLFEKHPVKGLFRELHRRIKKK